MVPNEFMPSFQELEEALQKLQIGIDPVWWTP
jgi:hypothetical protein